jgi:acyl carrier protein
MTQSQQGLVLADAPDQPDPLLEALRADIVALSEGKLALGEIDAEADVFDYGYLSSLTAVTFLMQIEERYGVEIEDLEIVEQFSTLSALADRIRQLR